MARFIASTSPGSVQFRLKKFMIRPSLSFFIYPSSSFSFPLSPSRPSPPPTLSTNNRMHQTTQVVNTIGCRVDPPGTANKAGISPNNPTACQERVLNILSFVLLAIHNHSSSGSDSTAADPAMSTGEWDPKAMTEHVYEAKALLDKGGPTGPNDMSRCIVVALQAYFLLLTNNRRQAIVVAEPLADLVADNPLVLHLPIVWSLIGCVRMLLKSASRTIAVERLQSAMAPLATHVRFSTGASLVEQELMGVFTGKPAMTTCKRKGGATTAVSAASAAAATATAGSAVQDTPMPESEALMRKHG